MQAEARKANACRRDSENALKLVNKFHKRLTDLGQTQPKTADEAEKLRQHYQQAIDVSMRELAYVPDVAACYCCFPSWVFSVCQLARPLERRGFWVVVWSKCVWCMCVGGGAQTNDLLTAGWRLQRIQGAGIDHPRRSGYAGTTARVPHLPTAGAARNSRSAHPSVCAGHGGRCAAAG